MSKEKFVFTADTNIEKALDMGEAVKEAFQRLGLKCVDCVASGVETLKHAALFHEKPLDEILRELNRLDVPVPPPSSDK